MGIALRNEARPYQPLPEGIALAEVLRVFEDCHTPGRAQLVARVRDEHDRWSERAVTSVGVLASGDLLMTLDSDPRDAAPVRFDDLIALLRAPQSSAKVRTLYATTDGGATMLVCHGGYVVHRNAGEVFMTFVPINVPQRRSHYQH